MRLRNADYTTKIYIEWLSCSAYRPGFRKDAVVSDYIPVWRDKNGCIGEGYPLQQLAAALRDPEYSHFLQQRSILCPRNDGAVATNNARIDSLPHDDDAIVTYTSRNETIEGPPAAAKVLLTDDIIIRHNDKSIFPSELRLPEE